MSEAAESTATVITSENAQEFYAQRLGIAEQPKDEPKPEEPKQEEVKPEEAPEDEPRDEDKEDKGEKKHNPKLQQRFSELTQQREAAREEARKERERADAAERRLQEMEAKNKPPEVKEEHKKPSPSDFTDAFEYAEALAQWSADNAIRQKEADEAKRRAEEFQTQRVRAWQERQNEAAKELEGYREVIAASDIAVQDHIRDAILESDMGPHLLYHLATNPEVAEKINGLSPVSALRELGKIEAKMAKEEAKQEKEEKSEPKVSKAPAPITPLKGANALPDSPIGPDGEFHGTYQEYKRLRREGKIK